MTTSFLIPFRDVQDLSRKIPHWWRSSSEVVSDWLSLGYDFSRASSNQSLRFSAHYVISMEFFSPRFKTTRVWNGISSWWEIVFAGCIITKGTLKIIVIYNRHPTCTTQHGVTEKFLSDLYFQQVLSGIPRPDLGVSFLGNKLNLGDGMCLFSKFSAQEPARLSTSGTPTVKCYAKCHTRGISEIQEPFRSHCKI